MNKTSFKTRKRIVNVLCAIRRMEQSTSEIAEALLPAFEARHSKYRMPSYTFKGKIYFRLTDIDRLMQNKGNGPAVAV